MFIFPCRNFNVLDAITLFIGHRQISGDQITIYFCLVLRHLFTNYDFDFSSVTIGQILMNLGHNDHLVMGIYAWKGSWPLRGLRAGPNG